MSIIHCTLQGKGVVGKTFVSTLIAQHLMAKDAEPLCIDADPVNATLSAFKAFGARHFQLLDEDQFNLEAFDDLLRLLLSTTANVVLDNGATTFVPFLDSLVTNEAISLFREAGKTFVLHTVIAGGESLEDTLSQFAQMAERLPEETQLVVWLNEHLGPIERQGKRFEQMQVYLDFRRRIHGIIALQKRKPLFEQTIRLMRERKLTFDEAIASVEFDVIHKQRLKIVQRELFAKMDMVLDTMTVAHAGEPE